VITTRFTEQARRGQLAKHFAFHRAVSRSNFMFTAKERFFRESPPSAAKLKLERSGDERARTVNPRLAKPVLSQLSYVPKLFEFSRLR
jgi:hypothetical protein